MVRDAATVPFSHDVNELGQASRIQRSERGDPAIGFTDQFVPIVSFHDEEVGLSRLWQRVVSRQQGYVSPQEYMKVYSPSVWENTVVRYLDTVIQLLGEEEPMPPANSVPGVMETRWASENEASLRSFAGEWVAIKGTELIGHSSDIQALVQEVEKRGVVNPLIIKIPVEPARIRIYG